MELPFFLLITIVFTFGLDEKEIHREWAQFKIEHNKLYRSALEERRRFSIFKNNLHQIEHHNSLFQSGEATYEKGVTAFADMTEEEFLDFVGRTNYYDESDGSPLDLKGFVTGGEIPDQIDWRRHGAVTQVKNQRNCGSCWSFSAIGSLEGRNKIKTGKLIPLSEQNLVDCSGPYGNMGCAGGLMTSAFAYIQHEGITTEENYPYTAHNGYCRYKGSQNVLNITGYVEIKTKKDRDLQIAVAQGPVSVAICVTGNFQFYTGGVFYDPSCSSVWLNHGVLAIGYGRENGVDYWIVKNSWGPRWGLKGYIKMFRGSNHCGIASMACYPLL